MRKTTTKHHGRLIEWVETATSFAAMVDGQTVTIRKLHPSTYQAARQPNLHRAEQVRSAEFPRYRVTACGVFVQPHWGFRRSLKEAKDDGVAEALATAKHVAETRAARLARK